MITIDETLMYAALVGIASGADASIWGMYKDAPHEGFYWSRFIRSMLIGGVAAIAIQMLFALRLPAPGAVLVLFGLAYAVERALVEGWKTFIREEDQSKYAIPMQFAVKGKPVRSRAARWIALGVTLAFIGVAATVMQAVSRSTSSILYAALAGLIAGMVIAVGGAWKDAPIEGFDFLKFWRSPALTVIAAVLLFPLIGNAVLAGIAAIGYERAASENYKTFFFPARPRGKFAGKPILFPAELRSRRYFVPPYVVLRVALLWIVVTAVVRRDRCLPGQHRGGASETRSPSEMCQ